MHRRDKALCGSKKGEISLWHVIQFVEEVCVGEFIGLGRFAGRVVTVVSSVDGGHIFSHFSFE